jgi:hypothetical protein
MQLASHAFPLAVASVEDWFDEWPPQMGLRQWQNGKSAKELAKAWFKSPGHAAVPPGFRSLLESHPATRELVIESVIAESKIPLDAGRPRHSDLVMTGNAMGVPVLIHVEAKADEAFARSCEDAWGAALRRDGPNSALPDRMSRLCHLLFGTKNFERALENMPASHRQLRYQLLYGVAATILDAARQRITTAAFVVHELLPEDMTQPFYRDDGTPRPLLKARQVKRNAQDFQLFLGTLTRDRVDELPVGQLCDAGEFSPNTSDWLHLTELASVRLFVGKAVDATEQL